MPSRPDDDERDDRERTGRDRRPGRGGQGRPRSSRARQADARGRGGPGGGRSGGARSSSGDRDQRGRGRPDAGERERGPRPPIKGKRRTFDVDSAPNERERSRPAGGESRDERWIDEGPVRRAADDAVQRGSRARRPDGRGERRGTKGGGGSGGSPRGGASKGGRSTQRRTQRATKRAEGAMELDRERLGRRLGQTRADRTIGRIGEATAAYAEDRVEDARKLLKPIAAMIPEEPVVRELHGLALYRLGSWRKAVAELEEFARLTGSTEQHPVLADCYRALGQHDRVEELWDEIGEASLAAPLVAEGRIVYAGSLADQGRLVDAIEVLEAGALGDKNLKEHHLRMRYVLGDLYDRAGEHQAARRWFESVANAAPGFFDVQDRLRQL